MKIEKAVITGVTGFFGQALAKELLSEGAVVYGVGRNLKKLEQMRSNENFRPIAADFEDYDKLPDAVQDDIDVFFHFAWAGGFTSEIVNYELQLKNAIASGDAVQAAIKTGAKKFVYAGTYNQYEIANLLTKEALQPRKTCIYSGGKTAANIVCKTIAANNDIMYNAGLVTMPYGENNYSMQLVNVVLKQLIEGVSPRLVEGNNLYDIVYIRDVARAFIAIAEGGVNMKDYYVGHRKLTTFRELMTSVRDIIAPGIELKFGEYEDNQQIDYSMIDLDALFNDTGFECNADFASTIKRTAEWVKNNLL